MPSISIKAPHDVLGKTQFGMAIDRDVVVIVEEDQVAEADMTRDRRCLVRDAFHQVTIAADTKDAMGEETGIVAFETSHNMFCRNRHPDRVRDALPERTRGGFDAGREVAFWMAGGFAAELPKAFYFVER